MSDSDIPISSELEETEIEDEDSDGPITSEKPIDMRLEDKFCNDLKPFGNDLAAIRKYTNKQPIGIKIDTRELNNRIPLPPHYRFRMANDKIIVAKRNNSYRTKDYAEPGSNSRAAESANNKVITPRETKDAKIAKLENQVKEMRAWINGIIQLYNTHNPQLFEELKQYHTIYKEQDD
jgi:hypothetical protein